MKKEAKDILGLLAIVLPVFILVLFWWFNSPLYVAGMEVQRHTAQQILVQTYHLGDRGPFDIDKEGLIERYGFTDEEINPGSLLEGVEGSNSTTEDEGRWGTPLYVKPVYYYTGAICFMAPWGIVLLRDYIKKKRGLQDE